MVSLLEYALIGGQTLVAVVFAVSAVSKVRDRRHYTDFVVATRRLSPSWFRAGRGSAIGIIAAEFMVPVLLLVPATVPAGFALAAMLLAGFTAAIMAALRRGERGPCHCFGASTQPLGYTQVARNLVLLAVVALGLLGAVLVAGAPGLAGALVAVAAGSVAAVVVLAADDIADLFRVTV